MRKMEVIHLSNLFSQKKIQAQGTKQKDRISEQELRLLFIEEFTKNNPELFYSIETPTFDKYNVGKSFESIKADKEGRSASLDMCVFKRTSKNYKRILNIEFKNKTTSIKNIGKDVLKLMQEKQNGVLIHLLNNTNRGTLCNDNETGVFNKLYKSFLKFKVNWSNEDKSIQLIILSLKQGVLIHSKINKTDLNNLKEIFFEENGCGNINDKKIKNNGWNVEYKASSNE